MGFDVRRRGQNAPVFNEMVTMNSTAAIIKNRVVKFGAVAGNVKHTTGSSGRVVFGVAINGATGAGKKIIVQVSGIATMVASTKAIAAGSPVRATSGAASTASYLGGTVKTSTGTAQNQVGLALTSQAAGNTGARTITVLLAQSFTNPTLL